jgi:putative ABC transport system substrate-binding protein
VGTSADPALAEPQSRAFLSAADKFGLELHVLYATSEQDFDAVFANLIRLRAGGLVISADTVFLSGVERLAALTLRHAVPAINQYREFAVAGGLISYGSDNRESYRLAGNAAARRRGRSRRGRSRARGCGAGVLMTIADDPRG